MRDSIAIAFAPTSESNAFVIFYSGHADVSMRRSWMVALPKCLRGFPHIQQLHSVDV